MPASKRCCATSNFCRFTREQTSSTGSTPSNASLHLRCRRHKSLKTKEDPMLASYRNDLKPIADLAQSFAARELAGKTAEHDRYPFGEFYDHVLHKAHEVGFLGAILPESLGGIGGGIAALCEILIHICEADASPGGIIFTQALSQKLLLAAGAWNLTQISPGAASAKDLLIAY